MLAMKIMAMRSSLETHDLRDVWELADICEIKTMEAVTSLLAKFYPEKKMPIRHQLILTDVFEAKTKNMAYSPALGW